MKKNMTAGAAGWLYAYVHFATEVACFYLLFSRVSTDADWWSYSILYNLFAFVPQLFFGIISDRYRGIPYGTVGCAMMLAALLLPFSVPTLILLCLGNCLTHIDGAQNTLRGAGGKITPNAVFVGGGAFGVITGQLLGTLGIDGLITIPVLLLLLGAAASLAVHLCHKTDALGIDAPFTATNTKLPVGVFVLVLFMAVAARSYITYAIPTDWKTTQFEAVLLFSLMGAGKMLGGVLADKIGFGRAALVGLGLAFPFLATGNTVMALSLIGITLFSTSMPITSGILASRLGDRPGFAFGITTVALFVGVLPSAFVMPDTLTSQIITVAVLSAVALVSIIICLEKEKKK